MADIRAGGGGEASVAFMVAAGLVYEIIAAACSSPQTTEINADKRSDTLMKWVHLGIAQSAVLVIIAAMMSRKPAAVLAGGGVAAGLMYAQYAHARKSGLRKAAAGEPGTEDDSAPAQGARPMWVM